MNGELSALLGTDVTPSLSSDDDLTAAFAGAGAGVVRKDWCVAGVLVGVQHCGDSGDQTGPGGGQQHRQAAG